MFQNMNPLSRTTAGLEIFLLVLLAFILGFLCAWAYWKSKKCKNCEDKTLENLTIEKPNTSFDETTEEEIMSMASNEKEAVSLRKIAEKKSTINFDRIGKKASKDKDDLKIISGIGPFIEKKLNALGIYTFEQISKFTPEDEKVITDAIEFFPGRIERDEWVNQAKKIVNG